MIVLLNPAAKDLVLSVILLKAPIAELYSLALEISLTTPTPKARRPKILLFAPKAVARSPPAVFQRPIADDH